jgi:hypothetical protein
MWVWIVSGIAVAEGVGCQSARLASRGMGYSAMKEMALG